MRRTIGPKDGPDVATCRDLGDPHQSCFHLGRRGALYIQGGLHPDFHFFHLLSKLCPCGPLPQVIVSVFPLFRSISFSLGAFSVGHLPPCLLTVLFPLLLIFCLLFWFMARTSPRGGRSGNPTDDPWLTPEVEVSSLSGPNVDRLWEQYYIPEQFRLFAPGTNDRINDPPVGQVAFYVENLRAGL